MTHDHDHHAPIEAADEISEFDVLETAIRELAIEKGLFSPEDHRRFMEWAQRIGPLVGLSIGFGMAAGYAGLLASYHLNVPSGPAIACAAALVYAVSALASAGRMLVTALNATRPT